MMYRAVTISNLQYLIVKNLQSIKIQVFTICKGFFAFVYSIEYTVNVTINLIKNINSFQLLNYPLAVFKLVKKGDTKFKPLFKL